MTNALVERNGRDDDVNDRDSYWINGYKDNNLLIIYSLTPAPLRAERGV